MARFLFIGGCERSGTSLLQRLLLGHSQITGGPELMYGAALAALYERMAAPLPVAHHKRRAYWFDEQELRQRFAAFYAGFFSSLDQEHVSWIAEKTPSNLLAAAVLLDWFKDAHFVALQRDARDVACSWREVRQRAARAGDINQVLPRRLGDLARRWNRSTEIISELRDHPRFHVVSYEALVADPEQALSPVLAALELDWRDQMLNLQAQDFSARIDDIWWTTDNEHSLVDASRTGRWSKDLPITWRAQVQTLSGQQLSSAGYPIAGPWVALSRTLQRLFRKTTTRE